MSVWGTKTILRCLLLAMVLLLIGCASVPKDYPRIESTAFQDPQRTAIGSSLAEIAARHPGESGFHGDG